jgi:hypothetical protein
VVIGVGTLGQLQLAQCDGTGGIQPAHHRGILGGMEVLVDRHARGGRHALRPAQILHRDRHAMQRSADLATHDLGLGGACLAERCLRHDVGIALEHAVRRLDTRELRRRGLHRGNFPRLDAARQFGQFEIMEG